jgi:hypothetical protein
MIKKTRYVIAAIIFGAGFLFSVSLVIFILTATGLQAGPPDGPPLAPSPASAQILIWVPAFSALVTAIGTISTVALAWKAARRDKREQDIKIALLERELEAARKTEKK